MSRPYNPTAPVPKEAPPWTPADVATYGMIFILAYILSPPWVMLFFRVVQAPAVFVHTASIFYAPLTLARQTIPHIDMIYSGYRDLLKPWMFES